MQYSSGIRSHRPDTCTECKYGVFCGRVIKTIFQTSYSILSEDEGEVERGYHGLKSLDLRILNIGRVFRVMKVGYISNWEEQKEKPHESQRDCLARDPHRQV